MKSVYEASTALEAHMVLNLLQTEGIEGRVQGEYLTGGIGELPVYGLVRVTVRDEDLVRARQVISEWESTQADTPAARPSPGGGRVSTFLIGAAAGAGLMFWYLYTPTPAEGLDFDGDGVPDQRWLQRSGRLKRGEADRNLDGRIDAVTDFDPAGLAARAKMDNDFDGVFETVVRYRRNQIAELKVDTNGNGVFDYFATFENGVLKRAELRDEVSGAIRKRQRFRLNKLIGADWDSDGDGVLDTRIEYDAFEEPRP